MESYGRQPSSVEDGTLNEWMATAENLSRETKLTLQTCGYVVMQQKNQRDYGKVEYATSIREKKKHSTTECRSDCEEALPRGEDVRKILMWTHFYLI